MWAKFLLLFFVFSFLFRTDLSFDQDLGRHIKLGEIIWQTGEVPKTNLFSYTNPDFPFINTHWLFEVFVYGVSQTIGLYWMLIFKVFIFLFSVWLIIKTIPKENQILLLPIGLIFLHVLRERLELRPEIFSFLFTAITLYILNRFIQMSHDSPRSAGGAGRRTFGTLLLLPPVQLIWINTHIYFFVGLILQAIFLIHLILKQMASQAPHSSSSPRSAGGAGGKLKLLSIIFSLSVMVSFVNPNGLTGFFYPLNVTKNYGYTIVENQTMFLLENINFRDPNFLFVKLAIAIIGFSIIVAIASSLRKLASSPTSRSGQGSIQIKNLLLASAGAGLTLLNVRSFPYLVFLSLPAVLGNFGQVKKNGLIIFLSLVTCALLLFESFFYLNGDYYRYTENQHQVGLTYEESVKGGMDFAIGHDLPNPIYNNFDIGSYIIYKGYPKYKVFVDGRPEAYPADFFQKTYIPMQTDPAKFKEEDQKWGFKTIIFSHTDQTPWGKSFLGSIVKDPQWRIVYIDNFVIILVKEEIAEQLSLTRKLLANLPPDSYSFNNHLSFLRLGIFLLSTGNMDSGGKFILKAREIFPESPAVNQIIGNQASNNFFW